jgi:hypothetical protein
MAESEPELPVEPVEPIEAITATDSGKSSNMGVIVLSVGMVVLCMVILYVVFFDKKMGKSPNRMNNNSMMPNLNRAPQALNSINMSSNGGYGYKANAF